jgi:chromosome partitioning protein
MKSLVLFNNKGGVGKTTLTFNIAHMLSRIGYRVVVMDFDPQCNMSAIFVSPEELFELWEQEDRSGQTVADCIDLIRRGRGGLRRPLLREVADNLWLLPGHLRLSAFEQTLAEEWPKKSDSSNERALDVTMALDNLSNVAAEAVDADVVLLDIGPSLGALNRSALLACDAVIVPLAPDLFSLQGLRNVGETLNEWRKDWWRVRQNDMRTPEHRAMPHHDISPIGYILQQHLARADRPVRGYARWAEKIPADFQSYMLQQDGENAPSSFDDDPNCIATIKHFSSLVPIAQAANKPLFDLKQADGIGGGQIQAVARCRKEFESLSNKIAARMKI